MSTSTRSAQNRKPPGMPTGGQFAETRRSRSRVAVDDMEQYSDELIEGQLISDREAHLVLDQARRSGAFWSGRYSGSDEHSDEAASRAMLAYLESRARGSQLAATDEDGQVTTDATERRMVQPNDVRAYVHRTVMTQTVQAMLDRTGTTRNHDAPARRVFDQRVQERAVELRRDLTDAERSALADEIRGTFPENIRPRTNFHLIGARVISLDDRDLGNLADERTTEARNQETPALDTDTVPGSYRDQAEQVMSAGGRGAQLSAKSLAWSLMAERLGGPHPVKGSISEYAASRVRKTVKSAGGAVAVARAIRSGEATDEQTEALFKPFGQVSDDEREAALHIITNHPGYGDDLWDASVLAATNLLDRKK